MPYEVFNPDYDDGRHAMNGAQIRFHRMVAKWGGPVLHQERTVVLDDYAVRSYAWPQGLTPEQLEAWLAFLEARSWTHEPFLIRDPRDVRRSLSLGNGDGLKTTFAMTTTPTDADFVFYPLAATADALVNGVPTALASVDQDARTVTFSAPPAAVPVVLRYDPLRLVRLAQDAQLDLEDPGYFRYALELQEVVRD